MTGYMELNKKYLVKENFVKGFATQDRLLFWYTHVDREPYGVLDIMQNSMI